ncbi:MAG: hypothetical protein WC749_15870, partial [Dehalococcoidia bacterium]
IGLDGSRYEFPDSWPCNISNVGVGPALGAKWLIRGGGITRSWEVGVIKTGDTAKQGPHNIPLEDIQGRTDRKVIRTQYNDVFGNRFESFREVWLKGKNVEIGPLQIRELERTGV